MNRVYGITAAAGSFALPVLFQVARSGLPDVASVVASAAKIAASLGVVSGGYLAARAIYHIDPYDICDYLCNTCGWSEQMATDAVNKVQTPIAVAIFATSFIPLIYTLY
jgi:hypothetical protein